MTAATPYPGVYIQEIPSGVRAITGVATSITAFVGRTRRGPVDTATTLFGFADYERVFGGLWADSTVGFAVRDFFAGGGGEAVVVRVANDAKPAAIDVDTLPLEAADPGSWADGLTADVVHDDATLLTDVATRLGVTPGDLFTLTVNDPVTGEQETFRNVTVIQSPRRLDGVLTASRLVRVRGNLPATRPAATTGAKVKTKGTDGKVLVAGDYVGGTQAAAHRGLYALDHTDLFNLLVIPPPTTAGDTPAEVYRAALKYCFDRRAVLLVDAPTTLTVAKPADALASLGLAGTTASYAALYYPRIRQTDPTADGRLTTFVASGAVAGAIARTDATRGVWKAPAGTDAALAGVADLDANLTDAENGKLNPLGINCLRSFPVVGRVVWGARTLRGADLLADEYKYLPVRRLALYIEESLFRGTQWVVFEPNHETLWAQIRLNVGAFLQGLFRQGAFQGASARDAYFVKCDRETTTPTDVELGRVNVRVGFAPLRPAEFVVLQIQQIAQAQV
ncbi:phage tail sheath family protein [Streptomyces sp. NPDC021093]|uniref:phage tail sheath family protein n=1 Tax=Streptomyces sp. NPDC021093 TaxID=3365112 RepID=UPI0037A05D13